MTLPIKVHFEPMTSFHVPQWVTWVQRPHVKEFWTWEEDETPEQRITNTLIQKKKYIHPYIVHVNDHPVGYIQCVDLYAYRTFCETPSGLFTKEVAGNFCVDLFIGDLHYINRGYGTQVVKAFVKKVFEEYQARIIYIDPAEQNAPAIRCYEKVGFKFVKTANDGRRDCHVMRLRAPKVV